jgi:hypothetical protein
MSERNGSRRILQRIGAVLAGLVATVILSLGTDLVMHATSIFPRWGEPMSDGLFLLATAYRTVYNIAGCYIAARLAPDRPMAHALALGIVGIAVSSAGAVATWDRGPVFGPRWNPLALIVLAIPCAWVGGKLRGRQLGARFITSTFDALAVDRNQRAAYQQITACPVVAQPLKRSGMRQQAVRSDHARR